MTNKNQIRKVYKKKRQALTKELLEEMSLAIANKAAQLPIWDFSFYHIFLPIAKQNEVNTEFMLHLLQGKDKNIVLAKSDFKNFTLQHFLLTDTTKIKVNAYGIPEPVDGITIHPQQIEVVFMPLLAFDLNGNRVGYGKGFYDRFLNECQANTIKIGLSFFEAEGKIDSDGFDVPLDYCITPSKTYRFKH